MTTNETNPAALGDAGRAVRESLTAEAAWTRLRELSMHTHRRIQQLAEDVVLTGELPGR